jgi:hypothetical protein
MAEAVRDERYRAYWDAIQRHVCASCLDQASTGSCGLGHGRVCAIAGHLPAVVDAVLSVESDRMDDYIAAVEAAVCGRCAEQEASGRCERRDKGECALSLYLYLVVDAIEEVRGREGRTDA